MELAHSILHELPKHSSSMGLLLGNMTAPNFRHRVSIKDVAFIAYGHLIQTESMRKRLSGDHLDVLDSLTSGLPAMDDLYSDVNGIST